MKLIQSFDDVSLLAQNCDRLLVLFNGGVESTYILRELAKYKCFVTALYIDLGGGFNREKLCDLTCYFGVDLKILDGKDMFANTVIKSAIKAQAISSHTIPMSSSLARPVIAKLAVEFAQANGYEAIIYSANPNYQSNKQLGSLLSALEYKGYYGSPSSLVGLSYKQKETELALIGLNVSRIACLSEKNNLWCRKYELSGINQGSDYYASESLFRWSSFANLPQGDTLEIGFSEGVPNRLNGKRINLLSLIERINQVSGARGIGRTSSHEYQFDGSKVLEMREAPAALTIFLAYRSIEQKALDPSLLEKKARAEQQWRLEVIEGRWFGLMKETLDEFIQFTAKHINGSVQLSFKDGVIQVISVRIDELALA